VVRFTGFAGFDKSGLYVPDRVTVESLDGNVLRTWHDPHIAFQHHATDAVLDELHLVFLCGFSVWNYLTTPFVLAHPDVKIEELPPSQEQDQLWRRLRAVFPAKLVTHSREQIFYFDGSGLQRRPDIPSLAPSSPTIPGHIRRLAASWFRPFGGHYPSVPTEP
jgi:hypothetical protein